MDKTLQDLAWRCLPSEVRKEIKWWYKSEYVSDRGYQPTRTMECLTSLFGHHNLTSDTEGEEMLTVEKGKVQFMFDGLDSTRVNDEYDRGYKAGKEFILHGLFGPKCLPDEEKPTESGRFEEPKPAEPKFIVGDTASYVCSPMLKHKCTVTKVMQNEHSGKYEYNVMFEWGKPGLYIPESDLEPYSEPEGKLGMDARGWFRINTDAIGNKIKVRIPSGVTEPYTEPEGEVAKMKPIKSKISVYLATKEEDEEFRTLLHKNGFMWNGGKALTSLSNWDSDHKDYQIHFVYPDKTVTFLGKRTEETLTFTEFKKRYFGEDVNLSQETANCDKQFDNIIKDGFREHDRVHIAAILAAGMLANDHNFYPTDRALELADALIDKCEKGVNNA